MAILTVTTSGKFVGMIVSWADGHGGTQGIPERVLLKFIQDEDVDQQK